MAPRVIVTLVSALLFGGAAPLVSHFVETETVVFADTPAQRDMVQWALGRYAAAGLELPPFTVEFAGRDLANCDGAPARTYVTATTTLIKICWNDRFILLHEFAHAWEARNVPSLKRDPFMAMRTDVESWAGPDVSWAQRGREHAANVIAWGVLEDPFPVSRTYPNDPAALAAAFRFLTGTDPLHDGGRKIQEPDRLFFSADRANPPLESGR